MDKAEALHIKAKTLQALGLHKEALTTLELAVSTDSMLHNIQRLNYADGVAVHLKVREHEEKLQTATQKLKTQRQRMLGLLVGIFAILLISIALYFAYHWQKKAYFAESQKVEMEKRAYQAEAIKAAILESELVAKELAYETLQMELSELQIQLQPPALINNLPITEKLILDSFDFSFDNIVYCQGGADNYVDIFTSSKKKYTERITLKKLEAILPSEKFRRVHKSYIINFDFLEKEKTDCFIMKTGEIIPRSRKK